ncbi:MAG: MFS transporter [Gemmatimonadetes bacterium]|uniref:MFS transporter n=1 Tax=Candidatus Kutchimonas denitrificans TaxID=3056748 RepID=A0AAE4ZAF3_9BACT|nr:MFS transporter [Gemmatimonadota bacterium]NIR75111.1 MFS transporter [Candidatus Kutchimonas denitrificans]NIS00943.1 MFS transporter [Gemmatimonadota bacterium]NIT66560.1 MFS transporter [Gemmatimonadota bacterium]NIU52906.1 MFS transporter [Gemmatimonadota bacterium]
MGAVLPIYFARVAAEGLPGNVATAYWGYTTAAGLAIIALISPVLGATADYLGAKKRFLAGFMLLGVTATGCLFFVTRGQWPLASTLFVVGNIGFAGANVFYDSLLPHIASEEEVDRVSTAGYALGYVGGGILLAINLAMIMVPNLFGLADSGLASRLSFISVAVWWFGFSIPLLRDVSEPPRRLEADEGVRVNPVRAGFRRLKETIGHIRSYRELLIFLLAFWLYTDGIGTIIKMASVYGTEIGIGETHLIGAFVLVQFLGIPFTFAFGALAARIGARNGIYIALTVYSLISVFAFFMTEAWHFWLLAIAVSMVQGGSQALSRSLYSILVPRGKSSEFFSFLSVFQKFAGIFGPFLIGGIAAATGSGRYGILTLVIFFVGGMALLSRVDIEAGRRAARAEDSELVPVSRGE